MICTRKVLIWFERRWFCSCYSFKITAFFYFHNVWLPALSSSCWPQGASRVLSFPLIEWSVLVFIMLSLAWRKATHIGNRSGFIKILLLMSLLQCTFFIPVLWMRKNVLFLYFISVLPYLLSIPYTTGLSLGPYGYVTSEQHNVIF